MKKKNLVILLLLPFLIASFCIITINTTYNKIDVDISYIDWEYPDMKDFKISDELYPLTAEAVNQRHYKVGNGSELVWRVENKDKSNPLPCAEIIELGGKSYLKAISEGEVIITCSNKKGNIYRQMTGIIYLNSAIMLYSKDGSSQNNIDPTLYYGEYDHVNGNTAKIDMVLTVIPATEKSDLIINHSSNISFDVDSSQITVHESGEAYLTVSTKNNPEKAVSFAFTVVEDGVNVYTYDDLLNCTNRSALGEIVVLRKNFESLENAYVVDSSGVPALSGGKPILKSQNTVCFGNYDPKTKSFSFADEIYSFETTYNDKFINQWNNFANENPSYSKITNQVKVGLRVQKDFYGNGFTVNMHNLTYPYAYVTMTTDDGSVVRIPQLTRDNLFRGPLKLYSLGDPSNTPLVSLYGQDNIGMYVDANNVTVNDINLKNCDFGDRFANLATTGTVLEVGGDYVTVINSRLSNGKHVLRSFSSLELTVKNCLLSNAQNFLFVTGSNEFVAVNESAMAEFSKLDGETQEMLIGEFLAPGGDGDKILNKFLSTFLSTDAERSAMRKALSDIQSALNSGVDQIRGNYKGSTTIEDTYFYRSGIASVCLETLFNGAFLQSASPSMISDIFTMLEMNGKSLIPYTATKVSGISYPVSIEISGDTRFYDYKNVENIELEGLIEENISKIANNLELYDGEISIDQIFPMKSIISEMASKNGTKTDGQVNIPFAYYGGGINLSTITITADNKNKYTDKLEVNLIDKYLSLQNAASGDLVKTFSSLMLKTVTTVTGFEPFNFRFITGGYLYGQTPNISDLIANAKGE